MTPLEQQLTEELAQAAGNLEMMCAAHDTLLLENQQLKGDIKAAEFQRDLFATKYYAARDKAEQIHRETAEGCARICWPDLKVWSTEEQEEMSHAFTKAQDKGKGWYETLHAVGAVVAKRNAAAIRSLSTPGPTLEARTNLPTGETK